jgi:hypothetical protein
MVCCSDCLYNFSCVRLSVQLLLGKARGDGVLFRPCVQLLLGKAREMVYCSDCVNIFSWAMLEGMVYCSDCVYNFSWVRLEGMATTHWWALRQNYLFFHVPICCMYVYSMFCIEDSICSRRCQDQVQTHGIDGLFLTCEKLTPVIIQGWTLVIASTYVTWFCISSKTTRRH